MYLNSRKMKLIKQSYEILEQPSGIDGCYKQIELAGRTCYKSEDKITEDSATEFVDRMVKSNHGGMLEHGTVYLYSPMKNNNYELYTKYDKNKYSVSNLVSNPLNSGYKGVYIITNYRVLVENGWLDDLQYLCEPTEHHEKRISVRFITSRSISHELVRHRSFSFGQESQRYCSYNKNKFNNEVSFILPTWLQEHHNFKGSVDINESAYSVLQVGFGDSANYQFLLSLQKSEEKYLKLLKLGWKPQQAREVLPNATKTEIVMTGFLKDWKHFFKLRTAPSAHPMMRELIIPLEEEFKSKNLI